jgi:hypothetical protein
MCSDTDGSTRRRPCAQRSSHTVRAAVELARVASNAGVCFWIGTPPANEHDLTLYKSVTQVRFDLTRIAQHSRAGIAGAVVPLPRRGGAGRPFGAGRRGHRSDDCERVSARGTPLDGAWQRYALACERCARSCLIYRLQSPGPPAVLRSAAAPSPAAHFSSASRAPRALRSRRRPHCPARARTVNGCAAQTGPTATFRAGTSCAPAGRASPVASRTPSG